MAEKVRELMVDAPEFLQQDTTIQEAAHRLITEEFGALPVSGADGKMSGLLTDRDIVMLVSQGKEASSTTVGEAIGEESDITHIEADDAIEDAVRAMAAQKVRLLTVVDGGELVGMVALAPLVNALPPESAREFFEAIAK